MFLLLFTCFSTVVSGIKIWPAKFTIEIPKWYDNTDEDNNPKIQITNVESHDVKVTVKVDNPSIQALSEGYSYIPDLSWIKVVPETITIPAKSSESIEVIIEVPEDEQSKQYNEKWESWVVVSTPIDTGGGINIQTELAVKLFIKTPIDEEAGINLLLFIFLLFFLIIILYIAFSYSKKKKRSEAVFYYKKKK